MEQLSKVSMARGCKWEKMIKDTKGRKTLTLLRLCLAQHTF